MAFLSKLLEANVDVRFADLPQIEGPTGRFMLQQMASVAELEAGMISARTKAALARSTKNLGGTRRRRSDGKLVEITSEIQAKGVEALQERAKERAAELAPTIQELQAGGAESLRAIAEGLNEAGIPTARGGKWSAVQVRRVMDRF